MSFKFNLQLCVLTFQVDMRAGTKGITLKDYEQSSEWDILDSKATVEEESGEASIIFTLKIQRKPRYLFISIIFPIFSLTILNLFVFVIPCDGGEKASYAITVFLAFAVFLTIVSSSLPENSDSVAVFSIYVVIQTSQSTLITVIALILIRLYRLGPEVPVPGYVVSFVKVVTCKCCERRTPTIEPEMLKMNGIVTKSRDNANDSTVSLPNKESIESAESLHEDDYDWHKIVNNLDWFFLAVFTIISFLSTLLCLILASALATK